MTEPEKFQQEVDENIQSLATDKDLQALSRIWIREISPHKWAYNFTWLGRPAIQFPTDAWVMQELIWQIKPDLIVETGVAHGGSLIMYASYLALLDYIEAAAGSGHLDTSMNKRKVLGIDIDIRDHNKRAIMSHPLAKKIDLIEGSSTSDTVIKQVKQIASAYKSILVCLDSNHTHEHVLAELEAYAPLVTRGSYCCVFDTIVEDMPADFFPDRPWGKGNNPKTAVWEYMRRLKTNRVLGSDGQPLDFEIDKTIENKLLITVAPDGYLKRK